MFSWFGLLVGCLTGVVGLVLLTGCFVWVDLLYVMKLAADARFMLVLVRFVGGLCVILRY